MDNKSGFIPHCSPHIANNCLLLLCYSFSEQLSKKTYMYICSNLHKMFIFGRKADICHRKGHHQGTGGGSQWDLCGDVRCCSQ